MATPAGFCDATVSFTIPNPVAFADTLFFRILSPTFIIADPLIVGLFPSGPVGVASLQALIDANATYIAFVLANPGSSITILSISPPSGGFPTSTVVALIRKPISLPQLSAAGSFSDAIPISFPFICVPVIIKKKKKSKGIFVFPPSFCIPKMCYDQYNRQIPCDGINTNIIPCPQEILYPNRNGKMYTKYLEDNTKCCYKLKENIFDNSIY